MGYTHYWTQYEDFSVTEWETIVDKVKKILEEFSDLVGGWNGEGMPHIDENYISFNGKGDEGCETFKVTKLLKDFQRPWEEQTPTKVFNFCKTRRQPYDEVVLRVLAVLKHVAKNKLTLASDGGVEIFEPYLLSIEKTNELC
jgi:hypothetical protein